MKLTNKGKANLYKFYALISYCVPMLILFLCNLETFSSAGSIFGFWGIVVVVMLALAFKRFIISFFNKNTRLTLSLVIFILGILSRFLGTNLALIGAVSLLGSLVAFLFDKVADVFEEHAYITVDGEKTINKKKAITDKQAWGEVFGNNIAEEDEIEEDNNG